MGKDFISPLPDDTLILIVARVGTNEAVRTSILSNRWRNLYKLIPDVKFKCEYLVGGGSHSTHDPDMFFDAVDSYLRARSGFKTRSLSLSFCSMKSQRGFFNKRLRFDKLVYSLGGLGIERLHLNPRYCTIQYYHISKRTSLTSLALDHCSVNRSLVPAFLIPAHSNISLQVIKFHFVTVVDGALEDILSTCLSLHTMTFHACVLPSKLSFSGPNLLLKHLSIRADVGGLKEVEVYACNLVLFEFISLKVANLIFNHAPKLERIFLHYKNTVSSVCAKLIKDLPRLKSLIFHITGNNIYQVSNITMGFNKFNNLRQLSLHLLSSNNVNLLSLAPFLQMCPLLQEFHLDTDFSENNDGREVERHVLGIHSELKKVEITGHGGTKIEIEFALYILKSAINLEQMQISRRPKWYYGCGKWVGRDKAQWSKQTLGMIHKQLRGQAVSKNARLTIQNRPMREHDWQTYNAAHFDN